MSKETAVIALGVWIIIVPQLGIPTPWRTVLLVISGLVLMVIGLYLRAESHGRRSLGRPTGETHSNESTAPTPADSPEHERKDRINSLN